MPLSVKVAVTVSEDDDSSAEEDDVAVPVVLDVAVDVEMLVTIPLVV